MTQVNATTNTGDLLSLKFQAADAGTILSGDDPRVAIVLLSQDGKYAGHLELSPEGAQIAGDELRKAAEKAATNEEDN